ncbi:hypothetical protein CVD28_05920 [Bacillus sp. M6-12]|uniref:acyl-CoA dehydrogenase family protein n=1 Tax=Bacillus sp. M6-12 TaxID=2054166 RepID=UPI000C77CF14|nr:acyl-CoA dehydrogenase family protein [Bacillus sp. M6-12]PLS18664.1 hypothetical protein CVD28_05920 [Bacillus sp. M6-12]
MGHWIFSDEHEFFRKTVQKFIHKEVAPQIVDWEKEEYIPNGFFQTLGKQGYLGITAAEEYGGSGLDTITEAVFMEELMKAGAAGPVLAVQAHLTVLRLIELAANERKKRNLLMDGIAGRKVFTSAINKSSITAEKTADGYLLNGSAVNVFLGESSDYALLEARISTEDAASLILVDMKAKGVIPVKCRKKLGWRSLEMADLTFLNVHVPSEYLIAEAKTAADYREEMAQWQTVMTSVSCVGLASMALECAIRYSKERIQFGKPLASFQSLRHKMADMAIAIEKSRSITYRALYEFDQDQCSYSFLASNTLAHRSSISMVKKVSDDALQIHGGAGYMMEFPVQRFWRDGKMFSVFNQSELADESRLLTWLNLKNRGQEDAEKQNSVS